VPRLAITLFGNPQARLHDQTVIRLESGKAAALLAYLATENGRAHSRQSLAELFWPDRSNREALDSLRFALSNLRATLQDRRAAPPVLLIERSQVQFNPQAEAWVDVALFQEQATAFETAVSSGSTLPLTDLQAALALYQGSFLQGVNPGDSLDFETWVLGKREQFERLRLRLLYFLGAGLEANGSFAQAEEAYRQILESQPWDENTHQHLMLLLASTGQYAAALAQYENCRLALREFEIEPGREINLIYHHIKKEQAAPGHTGELSPGSLDKPHPIPFVAREREMDRLESFLSRALAGQGQVALITGEAGSGKTALLNEFSGQALGCHPDLLIVGGRCNAYAGLGQPYQPFIECIQMLAGEWSSLPWAEKLPPENLERLGLALPQIAEVLLQKSPDLLDHFVNRFELAQRLQAQESSLPAKPSWQKIISRDTAAPGEPVRLESGILFEQVTRFFIEVASQKPLVLLLDDLQWVDPGSAALLFHLARRAATSRILILGAYRPGEVNLDGEAGQHLLLGIVTELQRYAGNIRVDLDQTDERAFVSAYLQRDPLLSPNRLDKAFCSALARRTDGNPLFTIELLRGLQARGEILRAEDGFWVSSPTLDWDHLPERVEAAIAGRIARLPSKWLDWLSTASIEGESFTAEVLARVHGVDEKVIRHDLSGPLCMARGGHRLLQAEGVQWLGATGGQAAHLSRYRFRHILFQTYLYQQLDPVERSQRHAAVGLILEELYAAQPEFLTKYAAELARHFDTGGLPEKAASYHLEAGKQAVFLASAQVAVAHYRRGLELLADLPHSPTRNRLEIRLYLALGAPFLSASGWGGSERQQSIQKALDLLQEAGLTSQKFLPESSATAAEWLDLLMAIYAQADWLVSQGELERAVQLGEQMLALAGKQAGQPLALAYRILGASYLFQGEFPLARRHLEAALAVNVAIGQPAPQWWIEGDLEIICRAMLGFVLAASGYPDQAREQTARALSRARSLKRFSLMGSALIFACEVAVLRKDLTTLRALADELFQLRQAKAEEMRFFQAYGFAADGYIKTLQAEPESEQALAGLALIQRGMNLWESTGTRSGRGQWIVRLADACLQAGEIEMGLEITQEALTGNATHWVGAGLSRIYRLRGELLLLQKKPDHTRAEACFTRALEIARQQGAHTFELSAALSLVKLWQSDRPVEARQLLEEACAWFTEGYETPDWQEAQTLLRSIAA
jgi:DNA-binding SARP family transcriptional activator